MHSFDSLPLDIIGLDLPRFTCSSTILKFFYIALLDPDPTGHDLKYLLRYNPPASSICLCAHLMSQCVYLCSDLKIRKCVKSVESSFIVKCLYIIIKTIWLLYRRLFPHFLSYVSNNLMTYSAESR